jgi:putative ABC transport system permease protein
MKFGANTEIANEIIFNKKYDENNIAQQIHNAYDEYTASLQDGHEGPETQAKFEQFINKSQDLIQLISSTFGNTAYVQTINNVIDKLGNQQIYKGLSSTINTLETAALICVTLMVSLIVILISNMLVNNSQKLGAILKALGYSNRSNLESFLSVYIPTILIGLIVAIPISILLVFGFTNIIFSAGGILLTSSIH